MELYLGKLGRLVTLAVVLAFIISAALLQTQTASASRVDETPEDFVATLFDLVSFDAGVTPDWDVARSMFIPEAVIVLRTSREATTVFSVEGWIDDFVNFIENSPAGEMGFTEKVVNMKSMVFGDMAHVLVLYEAHITGSARDPQQGVDSIQLVQRDGRWWIAAVVNELPTAERPLPAELTE